MIKIIYILFFVMLFIISCNEDNFLKEKLPAENYKTIKKLENMINESNFRINGKLNLSKDTIIKSNFNKFNFRKKYSKYLKSEMLHLYNFYEYFDLFNKYSNFNQLFDIILFNEDDRIYYFLIWNSKNPKSYFNKSFFNFHSYKVSDYSTNFIINNFTFKVISNVNPILFKKYYRDYEFIYKYDNQFIFESFINGDNISEMKRVYSTLKNEHLESYIIKEVKELRHNILEKLYNYKITLYLLNHENINIKYFKEIQYLLVKLINISKILNHRIVANNEILEYDSLLIDLKIEINDIEKFINGKDEFIRHKAFEILKCFYEIINLYDDLNRSNNKN